MPFSRDQRIVHKCIHTLESEVFIPLFSSGALDSYTRIEELSPKYNKIGLIHTVLGIAVTSRNIFGIRYFTHIKKSVGLSESPQMLHRVPVVQYHKIPQVLILKHLKNKETATQLEKLNDSLKAIIKNTSIQGDTHGTTQNSVGEENVLRRERRIFKSMFED